MPSLFTRHGIKAVLFDFDGTLANSALDFSLMRRRAVTAVASLTDIPVCTDKPLMEALAEVCALLGADTASRVWERAMQAVVAVEVEAAARSRLFPFTFPVLEALRAQGTAAAVITRNWSRGCIPCFSCLTGICGLRAHPR
jgi:phosphoglycolate phosphatase